MNELKQVIEDAQRELLTMMGELPPEPKDLREVYIRFLSMQYHLTKGVQRSILGVAAHTTIGRRRSLRNFLVRFASEEEFHYELAALDLEALGAKPGPIPFDVELWWAYWDRMIPERPLLRLGASSVLENIAGKSRDVIRDIEASSPLFGPKCTRFFKLHMHDTDAPHGDELLAALHMADFNAEDWATLKEGAEKGSIMYLRMIRWVIHGKVS